MPVKNKRGPKSKKRTLKKKVAINKKSSKRFDGKSKAVVNSRIRAIGNSKGVILNSELLEAAGITDITNIVIHANEGEIKIMPNHEPLSNDDLSKWDGLFKAAIKKGLKPENDLFDGLSNSFDSKEWK
jgi:antitoxin component of MazEF toxin-antitoxin module